MVMCCPISGGENRASIESVSKPRAAKQHRCCECGDRIERGQKHELVKGMWDGSWNCYRTCLLCVEIREHFQCDGWIYEQLWEDLINNFFPGMRIGGPCMAGLSPEAKSKLIDACLHHRLNSGEIPRVAVPPWWRWWHGDPDPEEGAP